MTTTNPEPLDGAAERRQGIAEAATTASRKLRHASILAILLIVAGTLAGLLPRWHQRSALRAETQELAITTVAVTSPSQGKAATGLVLPAEIKPFIEAPIYARASGYLKRYLVDFGAQVKAGDLLAEIDTPELDQELAQAKAQVVQAEAAVALAQTTAARWAELVKTQSVSQQETAEKQSDLELKKANLEAARANLGRLQELQKFQKITAPFDGKVIARSTDVGQLVSADTANTRELFRLAQIRTLRVFVRVPQSAAHGLALGQAAELTVPELSGQVFPAKIVRKSGAMSPESRTLLTELEVDNSKGELLPGTFAQVRFSNEVPDARLTLPATTLLFRAEGPQVGVVRADGAVELRNVELGRDFGPSIEIISGVSTNDRVILNPPDSLISGMKVRVARPAEKP